MKRPDGFTISKQRSFTAVVEIIPGMENGLKAILELGLKKFIDSCPKELDIHFLRWFLLTDEQIILQEFDKNVSPGLHKKFLVFSMNHDGEVNDVLQELYKYANNFIDTIYSFCVGYEGIKTSEKFIGYIRRNKLKESLFWIGKPGWSVKRIYTERDLREDLEEELNSLPESGLRERVEEIRKNYQTNAYEGLKWFDDFPIRWGVNPLTLLIIGLPFLLVAFFFGLYRQFFKKALKVNVESIDLAHYQRVSKGENNTLQNQLTIHGILKNGPTWYWYWKFQVSLRLARMIGGIRRNGRLADIESIHFVKWIIIPNTYVHSGGKKEKIYHCLFLSDYDGSWESYISDFIDRGARAINFNFSNMRGYPMVTFLFKGGAFSGTSFKTLVRSNQIECPFWYSNYSNVVMKDKLRNASISEGIYQKTLDEKDWDQWLNLFA